VFCIQKQALPKLLSLSRDGFRRNRVVAAVEGKSKLITTIPHIRGYFLDRKNWGLGFVGASGLEELEALYTLVPI
jgi:hypothetical protein